MTVDFNPHALAAAVDRAHKGFIGIDWRSTCPKGYAIELEPGIYLNCSDFARYNSLLEANDARFIDLEFKASAGLDYK
jgi:hypothetical protein